MLVRSGGANTILGKSFNTFAGGTLVAVENSNQHTIAMVGFQDVAGGGTGIRFNSADYLDATFVYLSGAASGAYTVVDGTLPSNSWLHFRGNRYGAANTMSGGLIPANPFGSADQFALTVANAPFKVQGVTLYSGSGAPNNSMGANGDIYFRSDGGAGTTMYQRRAGAWVATGA